MFSKLCEERGMTIKFSWEEFNEDLKSEIQPLLFSHWEEIAHYRDLPLKPHWGFYHTSQKIGMLRVYTVRNPGLIGYGVYMVSPSAHYSVLQANQDILYIDPEFRGGTLGYRFIKWCDKQLRKEDVTLVMQHVKLKHDFGTMLERIGYEPLDKIYVRRLN